MYALSLIPIIVAFVGVMVSKRAFESCILGIIAAILIYGAQAGDWNVPVMFYDFLAETSSTPGNMWVIVFTLAIGAVTQLLFDSGATSAFTGWVTKRFANNEKKSLLSVIILGVLVYADEFLKAAVLDSYGKTIGRKNKIPVETIGMLVVVLGIPLVSWTPMATWSVYFSQLMVDAGFSSGMGDFVTQVMPVMVFPIILTVVVVLFALGVIPAMGETKRAALEAKAGSYDFSCYGSDEAASAGAAKARPMDFVVPLVVLLALGIWFNGDLAIACLVVIMFEIVWFIARGIMSFAETMDSFWKGLHSTFKPTVYLMCGFTFTAILQLIGFPELIQAISGLLVPGVVLAFFFVAAAAVGTLTGMFWPATSLFLVSCLPVAESMGISPFLLAAVLFSAATFGAVISPRGALVMFIGEELGTNPVDLTRSARPYALIAGAATLVVYLVLGFVLV
ncbi:Na+/H+ antiporter NhaC family protein [Adlercreutzia sp. R25]|uniref:Na+/H+ antiporter NhaC family protein n=1 Tax=Adlercreutzia shanghongiae TaxID=3111773 RepID=A0ABU6J223_9ACTN|nr:MULTISPECIES: Na+/H+ antiporter NhaC family protein [unclassified Adlercreutzia]MEC4273514.1 Na+/H+ antiporter NhaC family protein [Adlercreutzia sp. R25]MEC4295955.1 Na+/H+ antiporter NhaC family protein [Adlercreutzia sp. R22]